MPQASSWSDVSSKLDPNMPQAAYDALRQKYFADVVVPKIRPGFSVPDTQKEFMKNSERPSTVSPFEKLLIKTAQFSTAAVKSMLPMVGDGLVKQSEDTIKPIAEREGIESPTLEAVGHFVGSGIALETLAGGASAITAAVLPKALEGAKAAVTAHKIASGGLAFGTYEALAAKDGDRVAAGIKGAAIGAAAGAAFEAVGGLLRGKKADLAHTVVKEAMTGAAPPGIQADVAEGLTKDAAEAKAVGMTKGPAEVSPGKRGVNVTLTDETGQTTVLPVKKGDDVLGLIQQTLDKGGSFDSIEASPATMARANKILRDFADQIEAQSDKSPLAEAPKAPTPDRTMRINRGASGENVGVVFPDSIHKELYEYAAKTSAQMRSKNPPKLPEGYFEHQRTRLAGQLGISEAGVQSTAAEYRKTVLSEAKAIPDQGTYEAPRFDGRTATTSKFTKLNPVRDDITRQSFQEGPKGDMEWGAYTSGRDRHYMRESWSEKDKVTGKWNPAFPPISQKDPLANESLNDWTRKIAQEYKLFTRSEAGDQAMNYWNRVNGTPVGQPLPTLDDHMAEFTAGTGTLAGTGKNINNAPLGNLGYRLKDPNGGPLSTNMIKLAPEEYTSQHPPTLEKGQGKTYLKPPPSEMLTDLSAPGEIRERPIGTTKVIGAKGDIGGSVGGQVVLSEEATQETIVHERIHQGITHSGLEENFGSHIPEDSQATGRDLAKGIRSKFQATYAQHDNPMMLNEAFTHAAAAVRVGNEGALDELGKMDTDVKTVRQFVNGTAGNLWEKSLTRDTAPVRAFQRRMVDLVRRTSDAPTLALREAQTTGWSTHFDPELGQWIMQDGDGNTVLKPALREVWDHIHAHDPSDFYPDAAHKAYFKGNYAPGGPGVEGPSMGPSSSESQDVKLGWQALSEVLKPTEASAAGVAKAFAKAGKGDLGQRYYGAFKDALEKAKIGEQSRKEAAEGFHAIIKDVNPKRLLDYGEALAHEDKHWATMGDAEHLKFDGKDLANLRAISEWDRGIKADGGVSVIDTLKMMNKVRAAGGNFEVIGDSKSPVYKGLQNGNLAYNELNLGKVAQWATRESVVKQFTGPALDAIDKLAMMRNGDGRLTFGPMQYAMGNFTRHMRNQPDASQKLIDSFVGGMIGTVEKKGQQLGLAKGWSKQFGFGDPRSATQNYLKFITVANMGARPALFVRDSVVGLMQAAITGPAAFAEGMAKMMTTEGRAAAEKYLVHRADIEEYFGVLQGDIPTSKAADVFNSFADKALLPSRLGHNLPRMVAGLGEEARALREITKYRAGAIDAGSLLDNTGAWYQDAAPRTRLLQIAQDSTIPTQKAAEHFAQAFVDGTQFTMARGSNGSAFRTGAGRLLGQYGTWPANYAQFVRKLASRALDNPKKGVPAMAMFTALNYGALKAAQSFSIDASKWLFFSPMGSAGSPMLDLVRNVMAAPEETAEGLKARKELVQGLAASHIPLGTEFNSIMKAIGDGSQPVNVQQLLGFKPLQEQDVDLEEWLKSETGLK